MIEISHVQARRWIRKQADGPLPEAQWTALQAHLEGCLACRDYRRQLGGFERDLTRQFNARWRQVPGPLDGLAVQVQHVRRARQVRFQRVLASAAGLVALLLVTLFGSPLTQSAPQTEISPTRTPTPLLTPTPLAAERFQGVVLFESASEGANRLHLLTAGPGGVEIADLGQDGRGSDPAWSPDGEWLAFLSDRSAGQGELSKAELFVMSIAGSRLTQLTSDPQVEWQGPLAWSGDGHWIALIGRRLNLNNETWVYLVPLDDTGRRAGGPRVLPGTRGVSGGLRFTGYNLFTSPYLLYQTAGAGSTIVRYDVRTGQTEPLTDLDPTPPEAQPGDQHSFDYLDPGNGYVLFYHAQVWDPDTQRASSQIRRAQRGPDGSIKSEQVVSAPPEAIRGLSLMPHDARLVYLQDVDGTGCWQVHIRAVEASWRGEVIPTSGEKLVSARAPDGGSGSGRIGPEAHVLRLEDLCVTSGLDETQWSTDGRWLVVAARPAGQPQAAGNLYALGMPRSNRSSAAFTVQRLDQRDNLAVGVDMQALRGPLRVRPAGEPLGIRPVAFQPAPQNQFFIPKTAELPSGLTGMVLLAARAGLGENSAILGLSPDGQERRVLLPADAINTCPAASPAGWIAFLSNRASPDGRDNEVFLMKGNGDELRQLTKPDSPYDASDPPTHYDCPVWSPDGSYLTAVQRTLRRDRLVVVSVSGGVVRSIPVDMASTHAGPVWTWDGRTIMLAEAAARGGPARLVSFPWRDPVGATNVMTLDNWDDVLGLSFSPDGRQLAMLQARGSRVDLIVYRTANWTQRYKRSAGLAPPAGYRGRVAWLPEDQVVFPVLGSPLDTYKFSLARYAPADDSLQYLVLEGDALLDWVINGSWLIYASEAGLWGAPLMGRFDRKVAPVRLGNERAEQLSWP